MNDEAGRGSGTSAARTSVLVRKHWKGSGSWECNNRGVGAKKGAESSTRRSAHGERR